MDHKWDLSGDYFEACNCDVACPCVFLSGPTEGDCKLLVGWHIDRGSFNGVNLNGLNVAMAVYSPKIMTDGHWKVGLYIDQRAADAQKDALVNIFGGRAGGVFGGVVPLISEIWGVSPVTIEYQSNGKNHSLRVENLMSMETEAIQGQDGKDVMVENVPFTLVPGIPATVAKSKRVEFTDHGQHWTFSGKNSYYSLFKYSGG